MKVWGRIEEWKHGNPHQRVYWWWTVDWSSEMSQEWDENVYKGCWRMGDVMWKWSMWLSSWYWIKFVLEDIWVLVRWIVSDTIQNASYHVQNLFSWIITSDWGHSGWCTNKYELFEWINWIIWFFRIINFNWKIKWLSDASENIRNKRGSLRKIMWARMDMHENYDLQFTLEGYKRMVRCMTRWEWI